MDTLIVTGHVDHVVPHKTLIETIKVIFMKPNQGCTQGGFSGLQITPLSNY